MNEFFTNIDNRELAIAIWLFIAILTMSTYSEIRASMFNLVKAFFVKLFIIVFSLLAFYYFLIVLFLKWLDLWSISQLSLTILWFITVGFAEIISTSTIKQQSSYFKTFALSNFKATVLFDFLINLHKMPLLMELLFIPIMFILILFQAVSQKNDELVLINKLIDNLINTISIFVLLYSLYQIFINFQEIANKNNLINFILPIVFSLFLLPFLWLLVIYSAYEDIFIRLKFIVPDNSLHPYIKKSLLMHFQWNIKYLDPWFKTAWFRTFKTKSDVDKSIQSLLDGVSTL